MSGGGRSAKLCDARFGLYALAGTGCELLQLRLFIGFVVFPLSEHCPYYLSLMGCFSGVRACTLQDCRFCSGKLEHELSTSFPFLTFEQREHLVRHYGFMARDVVELAKKESLMEPLVEGLPYLKAEVLYACR